MSGVEEVNESELSRAFSLPPPSATRKYQSYRNLVLALHIFFCALYVHKFKKYHLLGPFKSIRSR